MEFNKKEYSKKYYLENKNRILEKARRDRRRRRPPRQRKNCKKCGKLMKRIDHISHLPLQIREGVWARKKYCSELCAEKVVKKAREDYTTIQIHKKTKNKIDSLKYGGMTIDEVLNHLYEGVEKRNYGYDFIGMIPTEIPCIVKILCLQDTDEFGGKQKGDTFLSKYKEEDVLGEFWRGDQRYRIVNILSVSPREEKRTK